MLEIRARASMRSLLAEAGRTDERFLGPEWICIANDIVGRRKGGETAEELVQRLRERMEGAS